MLRHGLILSAGIIAAATSALFIQRSDLPPFTLAAARLGLSSLLLLPVFWLTLRKLGRGLQRSDLVAALPGGVLLGLHLGMWNLGVSQTSVASASLIVNLNPVAMPLVMFLAVRERLTRGEVVGSLIAVAGVMVLTLGHGESNLSDGSIPWSLRGDLICILAMFLAVLYLAVGKFRARGRPIFVYLVPLYLIASATCGVLSLFEIDATREAVAEVQWIELWPGGWSVDNNVLAIVGLALVPTLIGHSAMNYGMVHLRSQTVSIASLGQFVVAAGLDWLIYAHAPDRAFYPASMLIVLGAVVVVANAPRKAIAVSGDDPPPERS